MAEQKREVLFNLSNKRAAEIAVILLAYIALHVGEEGLHPQRVLDYAKTRLQGKELAFAFYLLGKMDYEHELGGKLPPFIRPMVLGRNASACQTAMDLFKEHETTTLADTEGMLLREMFSKVVSEDVAIVGLEQFGL